MEWRSDAFKGKTVMITGCNRGIGLEALKLFASCGADLICCTRKEDEAFNKIVTELEHSYNVTASHLHFNLADEYSVKQALRPLMLERRQIDVLVNNAGIAFGAFLHMTSIDKLKEVFQINFFSQVIILQMISKLMMRQKSGCIVNMGSIAGMDTFPGYTAYGSSKAALTFLTKTMAREMAPYGVRVNCIAPGLINTGMAEEMEKDAKADMIARSSLRRLGNPYEVASTILWLASDAASFVNGQTIRVDGGN